MQLPIPFHPLMPEAQTGITEGSARTVITINRSHGVTMMSEAGSSGLQPASNAAILAAPSPAMVSLQAGKPVVLASQSDDPTNCNLNIYYGGGAEGTLLSSGVQSAVGTCLRHVE